MNRKTKEFKESIAYMSIFFDYFQQSISKNKQRTKEKLIVINKCLPEIIDNIIFEIDDFEYDLDDKGIIFAYLNSFAITIYNEFLNVTKISSTLLLPNNEYSYEAYTNRASIIEQLLNDLKQFEIGLYSQRYSVDIFYKELKRKMFCLNLINESNDKKQNVLTKILPEIKKYINKKDFVIVCKIVQLLSYKNNDGKFFVKELRDKYIHEGFSLFDFSEECYPVDIADIIERFTFLCEIYCYFLFNYGLILLWFKTKLL